MPHASSASQARATARPPKVNLPIGIQKGGESDRKDEESDRKGAESDRKGNESDRKSGMNRIEKEGVQGGGGHGRTG